MATSRSGAVSARQRAAERVQQQMAAQVAALTEAVGAGMEAVERRAAAEVELADADAAVRSAVATLAELGQSTEQIAELLEADVAVVRSARRPKPAAGKDAGQVPAPAPAPGGDTESGEAA